MCFSKGASSAASPCARQVHTQWFGVTPQLHWKQETSKKNLWLLGTYILFESFLTLRDGWSILGCSGLHPPPLTTLLNEHGPLHLNYFIRFSFHDVSNLTTTPRATGKPASATLPKSASPADREPAQAPRLSKHVDVGIDELKKLICLTYFLYLDVFLAGKRKPYTIFTICTNIHWRHNANTLFAMLYLQARSRPT